MLVDDFGKLAGLLCKLDNIFIKGSSNTCFVSGHEPQYEVLQNAIYFCAVNTCR